MSRNSALQIFIMFGVFVSAGILLFSWWNNSNEEVEHRQPPILKIEKKIEKKQASPILDEINDKNSKIKNFSAFLQVVVQTSNRSAAKLTGELDYEHEKKFRIKMNSLVGSELDIGSDGKQFWFWSRRMDSPGLYWSTYDNFHKSRLKTPFNPIWLSHCLGIDVVDYNDSIIDQSENRLRVVKKVKNAKGEEVNVAIYIDPANKRVTGHGMYDIKGILEASSEILESDKNLPVKMSFIWHKEKVSMSWTLLERASNTNIDKETWKMPNIKPKIDMSRE